MRLASFTARGRTSFGVVDGEGVIDLRLRFGVRYVTLLDLLRAGALHEVKPAIAGARTAIVPDAAHMVPYEQPAAVLRIVDEWLNAKEKAA